MGSLEWEKACVRKEQKKEQVCERKGERDRENKCNTISSWDQTIGIRGSG